MSMTAVQTRVDHTDGLIIIIGTITLAGSYVTNGVTLDLSAIAPSNTLVWLEAWSTVKQGAAALVDWYSYVPGNGLTDGKLQIAVGASEMAAAAFASTSPTNATGYVLNFWAAFAKGQ